MSKMSLTHDSTNEVLQAALAMYKKYIEHMVHAGDTSQISHYEAIQNLPDDLSKLCLVSKDTAGVLMNIATYSDYATLRHSLGRRPSEEEYINKVQKMQSLDIDNEAWQDAFDFIGDLFDDNVSSGYEKLDG